jgi:hypothetical protein
MHVLFIYARVIRFQIGIRSVKSIQNDIFESAAMLPGSCESGRIAVSSALITFFKKVFCVCNPQYTMLL